MDQSRSKQTTGFTAAHHPLMAAVGTVTLPLSSFSLISVDIFENFSYLPVLLRPGDLVKSSRLSTLNTLVKLSDMYLSY